MGNAVDVIKEKSTYITKGNHEDGVAYFIDLLLQNQFQEKRRLSDQRLVRSREVRSEH